LELRFAVTGAVGLRERGRGLRDKVVASDPGLGRLRQAGNAAVAMATALAVEAGFSALIGSTAQSTLIAMLLGAVMAMMGSMALVTGTAVEKVRTAVFFPVAIGVGMTAGVLVAGRTDLMLAVFVVVMFAAVFVRRFGPAFFSYGFMGWMGYFFASFLGATFRMLPLLLLEVVIAAAWILLLSVTVLRTHPRRTVQRMRKAFGARVREVAGLVAELLETDPAEGRRRRRIRARLHDRQLRLADTALMVDGSLADVGATPSGWSAAALRRYLVDAQLAIDTLAQSALTLDAATTHRTQAAQVAHMARRLAAFDYAAAEREARLLGGRATDGASGVDLAVRRAGSAVVEYAELARNGKAAAEQLDSAETYEPAVVMMLGDLPGSPAVARDVAPRVGRWNALARLDMTTRQAIQVAVAGGLAIVLGRLLSEQRYYWAVLAAFIAFTGTATRSETFIKAGNRVVGTLVGLFASIWVANLTAGSTPLVLITIVLSMFLGFYLVKVSYAFMIFFITIMVGQLYSVLHEFSDALLLLRLEETAIGAAVGILVALFVVPVSTRDTARYARASLLTALSTLLDAAGRRIDPTVEAPEVDAELSTDLDGMARAVENALRQLNVVAAPMTRPMLFDNDPARVRRALRLYAASATHARALAARLRRTPGTPEQLAVASTTLAAAARHLAALTSPGPDPQVLDELARADAVLFDPAVPEHPAGRTLIHLQQLLHQLATRDFSTDSMLDAALLVPRRSVPARIRPTGVAGVVTGWSGGPVAQATVTLIDERGGQAGTARSDERGRYRVSVPDMGSYLVVVSAPGHDSTVARLFADPVVLVRHDVSLGELAIASRDRR
jgi:MFS family permease